MLIFRVHPSRWADYRQYWVPNIINYLGVNSQKLLNLIPPPVKEVCPQPSPFALTFLFTPKISNFAKSCNTKWPP